MFDLIPPHMTAFTSNEPDRLTSTGHEPAQARYILRLYVAGMGPRSADAIERIMAFCDKHLSGRHELEIIDIYQEPSLLPGEQIVAVPALIKQQPGPRRRLIGDVQNEDRLLRGLELIPEEQLLGDG
jgi:circadian clock protein KaiB